MELIKANKVKLLTPLQIVAGIVERKHTMQILSNVLLEKKGSELSFFSTDLDIQVSTTVRDVEGENDGSVTVNIKKLIDILRALRDELDVDISISEGKMLIKSGKSKFTLQTLPAENFSKISEIKEEIIPITLTQRVFKNLLAKTQFAMAVQDVRYYLNGLFLITNQNKLHAVATDSHRLAYQCTSTEEEMLKQQIIIPRKTVLELNKLLRDNDDLLTIEISKTQARFLFNDIVLITKLIDGKFPDYNRVIPQNLPIKICIPRLELIQATQRASILTNDKLRGVKLCLLHNKIRLDAVNTEQEEAQEEIDIEYDGQELEIGFNVTYLSEVLNIIESENIIWEFKDSNSSTLISLPDNLDFKYVVMPMRV